jgi:CubicO group peptidase (beta-lactamase class C family)
MIRSFVLLLFCPVLSTAQQKASSMSQIDSLFRYYFKADEPGGAVLLVKDDKVVYQDAFGISDIKTKETIRTNTIFNTGSISKTFVAYGILKLAADKKLSLDDNLFKYFPDFKNREVASKVKILHLLTHTSGIPDSRKVKEEHTYYLTAKDEENFEPLKKTESLQFEPGTRYRYSNPAFNGLALIIEQLTGKKWQNYIKENIFQPSGMTTSTITDGPHPESGVAHGYVKTNSGNFEELDYGEEPTFAASGNGGVWSSVEELWKYEQAIQQYKFLDKNWIELSRTIQVFPNWQDSLASRLGMSWFITKENGVRITGHTGSQGGFISDYCWLPEQKIFYVLLCNTPRPIGEMRNRLFSILKEHNWLAR